MDASPPEANRLDERSLRTQAAAQTLKACRTEFNDNNDNNSSRYSAATYYYCHYYY